MLVLVLVLVVFGLVLCLIGGIFLAVSFRERRKAALMDRVPTSPAVAAAGMRPGQVVEVTGTLRCPEPLRGELAGQRCAYVETRVERLYEEDVRDADDAWRTVERTETLASNVRATPFFVEDATGRVRVTPEGADVDAQQVFERFEERPPLARVTLGGVVVDLNYGGRTLGYRYREQILPIDAPVYVLGVVANDGAIGRPPPGTRDAGFIISYRSEEALSRSYREDRAFVWVGLGAVALGGLLIAIAIAVWLIWA